MVIFFPWQLKAKRTLFVTNTNLFVFTKNINIKIFKVGCMRDLHCRVQVKDRSIWGEYACECDGRWVGPHKPQSCLVLVIDCRLNAQHLSKPHITYLIFLKYNIHIRRLLQDQLYINVIYLYSINFNFRYQWTFYLQIKVYILLRKFIII